MNGITDAATAGSGWLWMRGSAMDLAERARLFIGQDAQRRDCWVLSGSSSYGSKGGSRSENNDCDERLFVGAGARPNWGVLQPDDPNLGGMGHLYMCGRRTI